MASSLREYKIVVLGDSGVGKSTLIKWWLTKKFEDKYFATLGREIHPLIIKTTLGPVQFNLWDIGGKDRFKRVREAYLANAQAAIILFDANSRAIDRNVSNWYALLSKALNDGKDTGKVNIPVVVCGSKVDLENYGEAEGEELSFHKTKGLPYCDISVKSPYNLEEPLLRLARGLLRNPALEFSSNPFLPKSLFERKPVLPSPPTTSENNQDLTTGAATPQQKDSVAKTNGIHLNGTNSIVTLQGVTQRNHTNEETINGFETDNTNNQYSVFVLCTYCVRMILIQSKTSISLTRSVSAPTRPSMVITTCRSCSRQLANTNSSQHTIGVSADFVRNTRMYEYASEIAGQDLELLLGNQTPLSVLVEDLADALSADSRVFGTCTDHSTSQRIQLEKGKLLLPYLPGGFL